MLKRLALLLVATGAAVALVVILRPRAAAPPAPPAALGSPPPTTSVAPTVRPSPTRPPHYRAGSLVTSEMTDYGLVRVRVTVAHGRIVVAHAIEIPHGNPTDVELSKPAVKTLERLVLAAQSTDVDMVSGATFTSTGYLTSVQAALDRLS